MIGKGHKQAIVSLVERKSGYAVLAKVKNKTADLVSNAIIDRLKPLATKVKTLTYDNGKDFAHHASIDQALGSICSIPDDHIDPRRSAFFMARSILRDIRSGVRAC